MADLRTSLAAFHAGHGADAWRSLGCHQENVSGRMGFRFAVWAPAAALVAVVGDFGAWQPQPMAPDQRGVWHLFVADAVPGQHYKFLVHHRDGSIHEKSDPFGQAAELRPKTASLTLAPSTFAWDDAEWMQGRAARQQREAPLAIYEVHLGSWLRHLDGRPYTYREVAPRLIEHVHRLGFTHVEFLPLAEFPYDPSWGYQVTGYFAVTSRYGTPDDLRFLVNALHKADIGVLLDWVPAHFPRDGHGLGRFDGTPLFEHPDPQRGEHPDWGTYIFNYGRPEVRSFLLASAHFWLTEFHFDGFRADAVASMLYLDYSRGPGQWKPNRHGGTYNLEAISFLQDFNDMVRKSCPGAITIAEESTAFVKVTGSRIEGGLGFTYKWNMGWMHDTLRYFAEDPIFRQHHHTVLTFPSVYAHAEAHVLPLSHDEVVHLKGSLVRKMGGWWADGIAQMRLLFGHQWTHPGKKLLFMGQEMAQDSEWNFDTQIAWQALQDPQRVQLMTWLAALNRLYRAHPALHAGDCEDKGFRWVEGGDARHSILVFERLAAGRAVVVVLHYTPEVLLQHWLPMPLEGHYRVLLTSDTVEFGGDPQPGTAAAGDCLEASEDWGRPYLRTDVAAYAVLILERV